jgi:hypothetical protein
MIDIINTALNLIPKISKYKKFRDVTLNNNFKIRIFGALETCSKVLIIGHGVGGDKNSFYVKSLANRFYKNTEVAIITLDGPGIGNNSNKLLCGPSLENQNAFIDEIIEYIQYINNDAKIYAAGFSAGALILFTYLTCSQNIINNSNKEKITHSFLISMPLLEYSDQLLWIDKNSKLKTFVSLSYSFYAGLNALKNNNKEKVIKILKNFTSIKNCIDSTQNKHWYYHRNNDSVKINATFFYSKKDPIIGYHLDNNKNILSKHYGYNILEFYGGGHCSFQRLDGTRAHEEIIYSHIINDEN